MYALCRCGFTSNQTFELNTPGLIGQKCAANSRYVFCGIRKDHYANTTHFVKANKRTEPTRTPGMVQNGPAAIAVNPPAKAHVLFFARIRLLMC